MKLYILFFGLWGWCGSNRHRGLGTFVMFLHESTEGSTEVQSVAKSCCTSFKVHRNGREKEEDGNDSRAGIMIGQLAGKGFEGNSPFVFLLTNVQYPAFNFIYVSFLFIKLPSIINFKGLLWAGGGSAACVYLTCKWNFFPKQIPKEEISGSRISLFTVRVHLPFTENHAYQIMFQTSYMLDLINLHNNINVEFRDSFYTFQLEEGEPQRSL